MLAAAVAARRILPMRSGFLNPRLMMLRSVSASVPDRPQFDPIVCCGGSSFLSQLIRCTVCYSARKVYKETHDHSTMFKIEKYFSAGMLPLLPAAYFIHGSTMDTILAVVITLHVHWGLHGVLSDYGRPFVLGPALAKIVQGPFSYLLSICLLAGLLHFNTYDVGITKAFEMVWSL
ncbi:unnamed protein product [Gongylonema pulchrum]|uniref:Succinate dehydrogenase [ubiquinone] cytochrome b small subunit n=1 Tax=Gongylonema pulchrum TaxID=637853 RepID=A0A183EA83_9BILA|nr:unnamed protein product [Gongylonema pulchrum]